MTRWLQTGLAAVMVAAVGLAMVGCGDDLYGECTIDSDSMEQCAGDDDDEEVSCVVDQHLECQTGSCGRYQGSDSFCTTECSDDGDCPSGECRQFLMTDDRKHCVADADLEED